MGILAQSFQSIHPFSVAKYANWSSFSAQNARNMKILLLAGAILVAAATLHFVTLILVAGEARPVPLEL
jgi:hypothetical protein